MAMTIYAQERTQNYRLKGEGALPSSYFLAMGVTTQDPNETGTECSDANYAREAISWNDWSAGQNTNNGDVTFAPSGLAGDQTIASLWLCEFPTGGHTWEYCNLANPVDFTAGQSPQLKDQTLLDSIS